MPKVNLLPWREEKRKKREAHFYRLLVGAALAGAGTVAAAWYITDIQLQSQQQRNQLLQAEINKLDIKLSEIKTLEKQRGELLARMDIIESLQASRNATVRFFNELTSITPEGVHLTAVTQSNQRVDVEGVAESNTRISNLMENINLSPLFHTPELKVIRTFQEKEFQRRSRFSLNFSVNPAQNVSAEGKQVKP